MKSEDARYLSVREVADRLGISPRTIYAMIWDGRIEGAIRVGNMVRIPATVLEDLPAYQRRARG